MDPSLPNDEAITGLMGSAFSAGETTRERIDFVLKEVMRNTLEGVKMVRVLCLSTASDLTPEQLISPRYSQDVVLDNPGLSKSPIHDRSLSEARRPFASELIRRMRAKPDEAQEYYISSLLGVEYFEASPLKREVLSAYDWADVWNTVQPMPEQRILVLAVPLPSGVPKFGSRQCGQLRSIALILARALQSSTSLQELKVQELMSTHDLSYTQATVLSHVLTGCTESQIAERIDRSHHTVHGHLREIHRRLGVSSRAELLALHVIATDETTS